MRAAPGHSCRVARPSSSASLRGTVGRLLSSCLPSAVGSRKASSTSESHTAAHPHARNFQRLCLGTGRSYKPGRRSGRKFFSAMQTSFFLSVVRRLTHQSTRPAGRRLVISGVMPPSSIQAVQIQIQFASPCKKSCSCAVNQRKRCHHAIGYMGFEHQ